MVAAPKLLLMDGGAKTFVLAVAVLLLPPLLAVMVTELFCTPAAIAVTLTENVQDAPAGRVPPDKLTEDAPAVAVMVPTPHVPVTTLGVETTNPAGRVSVKVIPVMLPAVLGFVTVKLRLVLAPIARVAAPKLLLIVGGPNTVTLAEAVFPVPPLVDVAATELPCSPAVIPVTFTLKTQESPATSDAPDKLTVDAPAVAVMVPESHVPLIELGVETTNPAGSISVNAIPVRVAVGSTFRTVNARLVLAPRARNCTPNRFMRTGELTCAVAGSRNKPANNATKMLRRMV
jgi:hypothetical protein